MAAMKTGIDPKVAKEVINNVLALYTELGKNQKPDQAKLQRLFSQNFELVSNTHRITKNLPEFQERIRIIQSRFPKITYSKLLEEPIINGNKAVIQYTVDLQHTDGQKYHSAIMAILTFEDDKIVKWQEVIHEKGSAPDLK